MSERREKFSEIVAKVPERVRENILKVPTYLQQLKEDLQFAWFSGRNGRIHVVIGVGVGVIGGALIATSVISGLDKFPGLLTVGVATALIGFLHLAWISEQVQREKANPTLF